MVDLATLAIKVDALEAKATRSPWRVFGEGSIRKPGGVFAESPDDTVGVYVCKPDPWEDAEFIAALRNAWPQLRALSRATVIE